MSFISHVPAKQASLDATITRCACQDPASHEGYPCPKGRIVNLGTVAYHNQSVIRRWTWHLRTALGFRGSYWKK